jgi:hypothetical protein
MLRNEGDTEGARSLDLTFRCIDRMIKNKNTNRPHFRIPERRRGKQPCARSVYNSPQHLGIRTRPLFRWRPKTSHNFDMAQLTVAEFRRSLMALAEALSEPGRRFTPDEVMAKGHELNPGQYGPTYTPP